VVGVDRAGHPHRQRLASVFVDGVEQFQHAAVAGGLELEVEGSTIMRTASRLRDGLRSSFRDLPSA
jgi:hypothetical protein